MILALGVRGPHFPTLEGEYSQQQEQNVARLQVRTVPLHRADWRAWLDVPMTFWYTSRTVTSDHSVSGRHLLFKRYWETFLRGEGKVYFFILLEVVFILEKFLAVD